MSAQHLAGRAGGAISTLDDLLLRAYAMELEAAERYDDFAQRMELHNNRDVGAVFRALAQTERTHAEKMAARLASRGLSPEQASPLAGSGSEGVETSADDELHYLMTPYHALLLALRNEERACAFFNRLATSELPAPIRETALGFAEEEALHVRLLRDWMERVPQPSANWAYDPDAPRMPD